MPKKGLSILGARRQNEENTAIEKAVLIRNLSLNYDFNGFFVYYTIISYRLDSIILKIFDTGALLLPLSARLLL